MKGTHHLTVQSYRLKYDLAVSRNLTVIQGNSATGKTTLVDMIQEYVLNGSDTGISLVCDCPCRVLEGNTWREQLSHISGSLVFVDEGNRFICSEEFARAIQGTDNYYILVTRESLDNLPYSVTEIYGIRSSGKFNSLEPVYHSLYRIYGDENPGTVGDIQSLIVEDSNAGYDFFAAVSEKQGIECTSAGGAGNIFSALERLPQDCHCMVVADGAAFGSQMQRVNKLISKRRGICLYLPESFEWLILSSDALRDPEVREILKQPQDYILSERFFSWERFFTDLLIRKTVNSYMQYSKVRLNPVYLQGKLAERIVQILPMHLQIHPSASLNS